MMGGSEELDGWALSCRIFCQVLFKELVVGRWRDGGRDRRTCGTIGGRCGFQDFLSGLVRSGRSYARARSLDVAKSVGGHVWFVAADHIWGEVGVVV
jgi:hypothetical protein